MMNARTRYWNLLDGLVHVRFYWQFQYNRVAFRMTMTKVIAALTGCGAIATLAASEDKTVAAIACMVAFIGQFAANILPVLEYETKQRIIQDAISRLGFLSSVIERDWYRINDENLSHDAIIGLCTFYDALLASIDKDLSRCGIDFDKTFSEKAASERDIYLANLHPVDQEKADPQEDA